MRRGVRRVGAWCRTAIVFGLISLVAPLSSHAAQLGTPAPEIPCSESLQDDAVTRTRTLTVDCVSDRPIMVPVGWTLDGQDHVVFPVNSATGLLTDPIVHSTVGSSTIRRLVIDGERLSPACVEAGRPGVQMSGKVTVERVTIRNLGEPGANGCGSAFVAGTGTSEQTDIRILESLVENIGATAFLIAPGVTAEIVDSRVNRAMFGLNAFGPNTEVLMQNSEIAGTRLGVRVAEGTTATITENGIDQSAISAVVVVDAGTRATISRNVIAGSEGDGIATVLGGYAELSANELTDVADSAMVFSGTGSGGTAIANRIIGAGNAGLHAEDHATVVFTDNEVQDVERIPVLITGGAVATVEGNQLTGGMVGIAALEAGTEAEISGNTVIDAMTAGINLEEASGAVSGNTIQGGRFGIVAQGVTQVTITENDIARAATVAISIEDGANAEVVGNTILNEALGIMVQAGAQAMTAENRISGGTAGIVISEATSKATIIGNRVEGPALDGIVVENMATAAITSNVVEEAGATGILVRTQGQADVTGNTVHGDPNRSVDGLFGPFGIRFGTSGGGSVTENEISGYRSEQPASIACAVAIELLAGDVKVGENVFLPSANSATLCEGVPPDEWAMPAANGTPSPSPAA
jgi:hypothetical protein